MNAAVTRRAACLRIGGLGLAVWVASLGAGIGFGSLPLPAQAAQLTLTELLQMLAQVKSGEARFVEKRRVQALDQTLEYSGKLSFNAPDVFVRDTLKPRPERLAVNGNTLTMSQGSRSRTLQLDTVPEAQVMVEAIRGTLTGNGPVLERHFRTEVEGDKAQWTVTLVPKDARLRELVARIEIAGRQAVAREVRVMMADGDQSTMTIDAP